MQNAKCRMQNAKCRMQNAKCKTDDKPRAEGKRACAMPRCEGGKAYKVGLMQNAKLNKIILNFEF